LPEKIVGTVRRCRAKSWVADPKRAMKLRGYGPELRESDMLRWTMQLISRPSPERQGEVGLFVSREHFNYWELLHYEQVFDARSYTDYTAFRVPLDPDALTVQEVSMDDWLLSSRYLAGMGKGRPRELITLAYVHLHQLGVAERRAEVPVRKLYKYRIVWPERYLDSWPPEFITQEKITRHGSKLFARS